MMEKTPHMVDMAMTGEDRQKSMMPTMADNAAPVYPYGLCIRLDNDCLEKLGVDISDWSVGEMFHLFCMTKITSKSENDTTDGKRCCVELQITAIGCESEDAENEEMEHEEAEHKDGDEESESPKKKGRPNYYFG